MKALPFLTQTKSSTAPLLARLTLGLVMFPHGAGKCSLDALINGKAGGE